MNRKILSTLAISLFVCLLGIPIFHTVAAKPSGAGSFQQFATTPGDYRQTLMAGGIERSYRLHIPPAYDGTKAMPLVFVLHGAGGNAQSMENLTGMSSKADAEKFIAVYPNGTGTPSGWGVGFNPASPWTADDVGFIRKLLNKIEANLKIDHKRIYSCGFSMGAMMTYRLGAEMSDVFAGLGIVSGTIVQKRPPNNTVSEISQPSHPLPLIIFHGRQDHTIEYDGGGIFHGQPDYCLSVADAIAFWVHVDGCSTPPQETTSQGGNLIKDVYNHCQGNNEIVLRSFGQGTHEYGHSLRPIQSHRSKQPGVFLRDKPDMVSGS